MAKLGFGLMRLPLINPMDKKTVDMGTTSEMIETYMKAEYKYFDCGYNYHGGMCEKIFGSQVASVYPRSSFHIATKLPVSHLKACGDYHHVFQEQLQRCKVDYFDNYLLHGIGRKVYPTLKNLHAFEFLSQMREAGRTKRIGFSYHDTADFLDYLLSEHKEIDFVQLQINYLDWNDSGIQAKSCYDICVKHNKHVIIMEPLKGGLLSQFPDELQRQCGFDPTSLVEQAFQFVASLNNVDVILSGMSSIQQVNDNLMIFNRLDSHRSLNKELLLDFADRIRNKMAYPCTSCRYCNDVCPSLIPIPEITSLVNNALFFGVKPSTRIVYNNLLFGRKHQSTCIQCGKCETECPQHLSIRDILSQANQLFHS